MYLMNSSDGQRCEPLSKGAPRYGPFSVTFVSEAVSAALRCLFDDNNFGRANCLRKKIKLVPAVRQTTLKNLPRANFNGERLRLALRDRNCMRFRENMGKQNSNQR